MNTVPPRQVVLEWARRHCPDLLLQEGMNGWRAVFTFAGQRHIVEALGADAHEVIGQRIWVTLRGLLGEPAAQPDAAAEDDLVRNIMLARAAGQHDAADEWERRLIMRNTGTQVPPLRRPPRDQPGGRMRQKGFLNPNRKVY